MASSLDRLFGSKTRVALLSKLVMNPDSSFYIRELSRELNVPYSMLYKEIKNLVSLGILNEEKRGKITLVSVNTKLPYFAEIRQLLAKTVGLGDLARSRLTGLKGVVYALIYGSVATGEESESSDIDMLIIGEMDDEEALKAINEIEKEVGREVNHILWSEKEFMKRVRSRHHLLVDIAGKPAIMIIGEEDEFRRTIERQKRSKDQTKP